MPPRTAVVWNAAPVKFGFEQHWNASAEDVIEVYLDPDFWGTLDGLSATSAPEVLEVTRKQDSAVVRLRYRLTVSLPSEASRFIDTDDVAWVEQTSWDLLSRSASISFAPDQAASLMRAAAKATLISEGDTTLRQVRGDIRVRIPLLGSRVERVVVEGIGDHLGEEADAVAGRLPSS
jgi:hypothetical protein